MLILQTGPETERLRVHEIDDDEGRRLVRIVRRGRYDIATHIPACHRLRIASFDDLAPTI